MHIFTPRAAPDSDHRLRMMLSDQDKAKVRRGRWSGTVKDQESGQVYKVRGASCGLPRCFCDAVITDVVLS